MKRGDSGVAEVRTMGPTGTEGTHKIVPRDETPGRGRALNAISGKRGVSHRSQRRRRHLMTSWCSARRLRHTRRRRGVLMSGRRGLAPRRSAGPCGVRVSAADAGGRRGVGRPRPRRVQRARRPVPALRPRPGAQGGRGGRRADAARYAAGAVVSRRPLPATAAAILLARKRRGGVGTQAGEPRDLRPPPCRRPRCGWRWCARATRTGAWRRTTSSGSWAPPCPRALRSGDRPSLLPGSPWPAPGALRGSRAALVGRLVGMAAGRQRAAPTRGWASQGRQVPGRGARCPVVLRALRGRARGARVASAARGCAAAADHGISCASLATFPGNGAQHNLGIPRCCK